MGGWNNNISGFWVAKYEMSGSASALTSVPATASLTDMSLGTQYIAARGAKFGYTGVEETIAGYNKLGDNAKMTNITHGNGFTIEQKDSSGNYISTK